MPPTCTTPGVARGHTLPPLRGSNATPFFYIVGIRRMLRPLLRAWTATISFNSLQAHEALDEREHAMCFALIQFVQMYENCAALTFGWSLAAMCRILQLLVPHIFDTEAPNAE
jgi:hypothetical protein